MLKGDKIYALCDYDMLQRYSLSLEEFVVIAKKFDAQVLQYRDKNGSFERKQQNLQKLRSLWPKTLIINDEIGLVQFCDGLHIGQEDLAVLMKSFGIESKALGVVTLRKMIGKKIIGLSTHNSQEVVEANSLEIDYIGLGAYRISQTKDVAAALGERLTSIAALSRHPVAAIGGVRLFDHIPHATYKAIGSDLVIKALTYA
ncbi:thiamine phosphate synthase [Nitratiruptor sp. YY09-18]|uniref:thiamine phosphate synthase n=1 Tax=Nitratiruptor sp. YY09-18 TaxID=2724901 RepID=UPI0019162050|nr:thiamine phosphate synthase [Nitratiruptor sp. YY09-18]BCD67803.1 thiamine-phosphate pyrophosphorylase [Nitratiruptor sp. YY09-18]